MADIRIKDLNPFSGTPTADDFLAIDGASETKKIAGNTFALNSKIDYAINEIKSAPNGTAKIIVSDIPPASIGDTSLGNEEYFKSTVKKLCETYPNRTQTLFIGRGTPNSSWYYEIFIYNTSEINSEGFPRYAFGRAITFNNEYFGLTSNYVWAWRKVKTGTNLDVTRLPSGSDLNTLIGNEKSGFYYITTGVANVPDNLTYAALLVIANDNVTFQIVSNQQGIWWRAYTGSPIAWRAWKSIGFTTYGEFTGDYISGKWNVRRNGDVVTMQVGNFTNIPTGEFRMNGVVPVGFRPAATVSYTIVSREATPRVFALSITPTGDLIFYNYSSACAGVLPIANVFTYLA